MTVVWCALYILIIAMVGAAATCAIIGVRRASLAEIAALTIALGLGVTGMLLIWISMLGLVPGRRVILSIGLIALVTLAVLIWRGRFPRPGWPVWERKPILFLLTLVPLLAVLGAFAAVLVLSIGFRTMNWDSVVIWGMKARVMHYFPLTPRPWYFDDVRFTYSHLDYPLLSSMLTSGAFDIMGAPDDQPSRIVLPMIYAGQVLLVYVGARQMLSRLPALLITLIASCPQFVLVQASMGSADMPLSMFRAGTLLYLLRWWDQPRRDNAILCGLFTFFAAMTKSEGLPLALIAAALFVAPCIKSLRQREIRISLAAYFSILAVGLGIWFVWKIGIPHTDENYFARLRVGIIFGNMHRLGQILATMARTTTHWRDWGVLWLLIPVAAAIGYPAFRRPHTWMLWAALLLHVGLYIFVYIVTPWDLGDLMFNSLDRLLIHIAPAAALVLAAHFSATPTLPTRLPASGVAITG